MAKWNDSVLHWKRKLEKGVPNEKILEILHKLKKVPITVELLQETGIGKVVNSLKKYDGDVASKAEQLVAQWKGAVVVRNDKSSTKVPKDNKNNGNHVNHQPENKYLSKTVPTSHKSQKYKYLADSVDEEDSYYDPKSSKDDYRDFRSSKTEDRVTYNPNSTQEDYRKFLESYQENSNTGVNEDSSDNKYTSSYTPTKYTTSKNCVYGSEDEGNVSEHNSIKYSSKYKLDQDPEEYENILSEDSFISGGSGKVKSLYEQTQNVRINDKFKDKSASSSTKTNHLEKNSKQHTDHSKKSSKHEKEPKDSERTKSSKKSSSKKSVKVETLSDGFNSSVASFEACLGFNDEVLSNVKSKPKSSTTPVKMPTSKSVGKSSQKLNAQQPKSSEKVKQVKSDSPKKESSKKDSSKSESSKAHKTSKRKPEKDADAVPDALKKPKLKPLDQVDVLSTLPEIQPEYKPLRLRMPDSPPPKKKASMSNEEAIAYTSSRKEKTAVYAGRRHQFLSEVPSLFDSCVRVLIENIDGLGYTGGVPYDLLKPILEKCTPVQLYTFEDYNHYLMEETTELWEVHSKRDFKCKEPDEDETWRDLYLRLYDEREAKLKSVTANISASMAKATPVRQTKLAYVDSVAKPPRGVARKQARYGTGLPVAIPMRAGPPSKPTTTPRPTAPAMNALATAAAAAASSGQGSQLKKIVKAPLMQKTLKFMKQRFRR